MTTLPAPAIGACALDLTVEDHEAIRYFRTEFAKVHHTKNPSYSLISLMFNIARDESMVMHMVVAIGLQEMDFRRLRSETNTQQLSTHHYSSALRLMAAAIAPTSEKANDLDITLTVSWLMLLYEQQFGDAKCRAYLNHSQGVSSLLQSQDDRLLQLPPYRLGIVEQNPVTVRVKNIADYPKISLYSARVLIWILLLDSAAATSGVGGQVNAAILSMLLSNPTDSLICSRDPIKAVARLLRYSNSLYRLAWGEAYPQAELVDDVENRNIYSLLGHCAYLRFMTAQLAKLYRKDPALAAMKALDVEHAIDEVGDLFRELMEVASDLTMETNNNHRLVANMRAIVPMYYAIILDFMRLSASDKPLSERQRHALKEIMKLCYQDSKHSGGQANLRIAWPLLMVALESEDMLHRDWCLEQFAVFSRYGKNFERAYRFLIQTISVQQRLGKRIDIREQMEQTDMFVLG